MPIDRELIVRRISLIGEDLLRLRPLADLPVVYLTHVQRFLDAAT